MKNFMRMMRAMVLAALSGAMICAAQAQQELEISRAVMPLIPVSLNGYSGEVESVLSFDLEALGLKITSQGAQYSVTGSAGGQVSGTLAMVGGQTMFSRTYSGGSLRAQAHSLADDIVAALRQTPPIFHGKIAYKCQVQGISEIFVSDFDGHNPVQLTHDGSLVDGPAWVPGGQELLYTSWKSGNTQILAHNVRTGARRVLAGYPGSDLSPAVSKDGRRVAMILSQGGSPNLWVSDIDGSGLKQLTQSREEDSSPTWSPDGSQICYVHRAGRAGLRIVRADGGPSIPVRTGVVGNNVTGPDWSPDGKLIAFTAGSGNFTICVVPAEGGEAQRLAAGEDPCWAPNSRTIIFSRRTGDRRVLCLLDVPTKSVKDVRQLSGSCSEPSWAR